MANSEAKETVTKVRRLKLPLLVCCVVVISVTVINHGKLLKKLISFPRPITVRGPCIVGNDAAWLNRSWKLAETPPWMTTSKAALYIHNAWSEGAGGVRLGNQLCFYASLFGIAWLDAGRHIPLWPDKNSSFLRNAFPCLRVTIDIGNTIISSSEFNATVMSLPSYRYSSSVEHLQRNRNITMYGYVVSWKFFDHVDSQLRHDLTFNDSITSQARRFINNSTPPGENNTNLTRVVIHVRRGDYSWKDGEMIAGGLYPIPGRNYHNRAMTHFELLFPGRVQFVMLSEDPDWCVTNIGAGRQNIVYSRGNSEYVDLAIASLCDHAIFSIGTYGWWAAWYANGITIRPRFCLRANASTETLRKMEAFYKPEWLAFDQC